MLMGEAFFNADIFPTEDQYHELVRYIKKHNFDHLCRPRFNLTDINEIQTSSLDDFSITWGDPVDHIIRFSEHLTKPTFTFQIYSTGKIGVTPYFPITVGDINKHGLKDYWKAGLNRIWEADFIQESAKRIRSIQTLGNALPPLYFSTNVDIDLIDDSPEDIKNKTKKLFA